MLVGISGCWGAPNQACPGCCSPAQPPLQTLAPCLAEWKGWLIGFF